MPHQSLTAVKDKQTSSSLFNPASQKKRIIPIRYQVLGLVLNALSHLSTEWAARIISDLWFKVFKNKVKPWTTKFWQQADECVTLSFKNHTIPVYIWGDGPLVVMMHGWSGSGSQFRKLIPGLVKAGYKVAAFDAPAHGSNPGKKSHLLEFCDTLIAIQDQLGSVDTIMAHSFGGMAAIVASQRGFDAEQMILFGPHLDAHEMHQTYSDLLGLNPKLSMRFRELIEKRMVEILKVDDVWTFLTPENLLTPVKSQGLLIYDLDDEEISQSQFEAVQQYWQTCETIQTQGLGHHRILKDRKVIETVLAFMKKAR